MIARRTMANASAGFTLFELLVVIVIVAIVSAAALPVVLPAINQRAVSESARILQATLAGTRDLAIRANAPRGIRFIPDPLHMGNGASKTLAANRFIQIEPAADYIDGKLSLGTPFLNDPGFQNELGNPAYLGPASFQYTPSFPAFSVFTDPRIGVQECKRPPNPPNASGVVTFGYNSPTGWFWNIRQGDKIRFNDSGLTYTIAGPMQVGVYSGGTVANPERFINYGAPNFRASRPTNNNREFLFLVNGRDDDGDGYIDEGFDGLDNDNDGVTDPGFNGIDNDGDGVIDNAEEVLFNSGGEFEQEEFIGASLKAKYDLADNPVDKYTAASGMNGLIDDPQEYFPDQAYTISRRPTVSEGAREVFLPSGVLIDMTTWNAGRATTNGLAGGPLAGLVPERSRLPIDPYTKYVDIMLSPSGQVVTPGAGLGLVNPGVGSGATTSAIPFYHFWLAEREDVVAPLWGTRTSADLTGAIPLVNPLHSSATNRARFLLPVPKSVANLYAGTASATNGRDLKGERRILTLFTRTGQIVSTAPADPPNPLVPAAPTDQFNGVDANAPFYQPQLGAREISE